MLPDWINKIKDHQGFRRYFENTGWMFFGRISSLLVNFFVGAYIARYLGPDQFGLMNYVISFAGIFTSFAALGIDGILIRELIAGTKDKMELLGSAFIIRLVGAFSVIFLVMAASFAVNQDPYVNLLVFVFSLFSIFQTFNIIDYYFQARVQAKKTILVHLTVMAVSSLMKLAFIYLGLGLFFFIFIYTLDNMFLAIGFYLVYRHAGQEIFKWRFNRTLMFEMLRSSWPLLASGIAISIYMRIDQVIINFLIDERAVGLYAPAVKLSEVWYFLPVVICNSLFPAIVNAKAVSEELFRRRLHNLYSLMFFLSVFSALATFFLAEPIVKYLFGTDYLASIDVLKIYAFSNLGMFLSTAVNNYLLAENLTKISFVNNLIGMVMNVALNLILIPKFGISGAAIATVVSYLAAAYSVLLFKKTRSHGRLLLYPFVIRKLYE